MTNTLSSQSGIIRYASLLACVLSCALVGILFTSAVALADVRSSDVVGGASVEDRGFSTSLCPSIEANYAILVDNSGKVYFERGAHEGVHIASITKIMTAIVALDYDPNLASEITVSEEAAAIGESSATLAEGDTLDMRNALTAMMVASGNDAAESIATSLGRQMLVDEGHPGAPDDQCVQRYVDAMNEKAAAMGLENTVFTNPHGLDDGEYEGGLHSTAADVATEVAYAMGIATFREIVARETATVEVNRGGETIQIDLTSTDELLGVYEGTVGVKTGTTDLAGACFAGANVHDGREYYAIVLDSTDEWQRFVDTQALWDWCYAHSVDYPLVHTTEYLETTVDGATITQPVLAHVSLPDWMDRTVAATIADPAASVHLFELDGNISQEVEYEALSGNISAGDKVGTITFKQRNQDIAVVDLVAAEDAPAPDPFTAIGIWWQRLWGDDTVAPSVLVNETPLLVDKTQTITPSA